MIRLLTAVLLSAYSHFGWAMAYPEDYTGVPHGDFQEGEVIDHTKFNQNNLSIKEAINDRVPVPSNCSTNQIIKYDGGGWFCTNMPADGADGAPGADGVAAGLNCTTDQSIVYRNGAWVCSSPEIVNESDDTYPYQRASCPGDKKVTGGGRWVFSSDNCVSLISRPELDLSGWYCQVSRSGNNTCEIRDVWAICQ